MEKMRNEQLDYYKGMLMFGVILGHVITAYKAGATSDIGIHVFVRTYDMPFFMIISGWFLAKTVDNYVPWKNIVNKITSIIIPIIIWGSGIYICKVLIGKVTGDSKFQIRVLLNSFTGNWFLWSVFICSCLMIIVCGIFKNDIYRVAAVCIITVSLLFIPYDKYNIAYMFPFYGSGFFLKGIQGKLSIRKIEIMKVASVITYIILLCFWKTKYNVWNAGSSIVGENKIGYNLLVVLFRFIIGITGCVTMSIIFGTLEQSENILLRYIRKEFISVGKNTLVLYILQGFIVESLFATCIKMLVNRWGGNPFIYDTEFLGFVISPITTFICILILNTFIVRVKQIPYIGEFVCGFKVVDARK